MAGDSFFGDLAKPAASSAPAGGGSFFADLKAKTDAPDLEAAKARNAMPTEFEKEHAGDVEAWKAPWTNLGEGAAKSLLSLPTLVGEGLNKIPGIGEKLAPSAGLRAEEQIGTPRNAIQELGKQEGGAIQAAAAPVGEAIAPLKEAASELAYPVIRPLAEYGGEFARGIPGAAKVLDAVEGAPNVWKAATRGAGSGAAFGAIPGLYHLNPRQALEGAASGAAFGGVLGAGAYGVGKLPGMPELGSSTNPEIQVSSMAENKPGKVTPEAMPERFPTSSTAKPGGKIPTINDLGKLIESEGAGATPLKRDVPIGKQVPAKFPEVGQVPLGNRVAMDVRDMSGERRMNAPEKIPTIPQEEVGRQMGAPPLQPNRPLREQFQPDAEAMAHQSEKARIEAKYPDSAIRQMVHSNGEEMVDAIGDNPDLLRQVHDLRNPDVRQAAINGGMNMVREDGSPIMVNNRKASGDMPRQKVFSELLKRGYSPEQIHQMAQEPEAVGAGAGKPGPQRAAGGRKLEREAGD